MVEEGQFKKRLAKQYYAVRGEYDNRIEDAVQKGAVIRDLEEAKKEFPWQILKASDPTVWIPDLQTWFLKWFGGAE